MPVIGPVCGNEHDPDHREVNNLFEETQMPRNDSKFRIKGKQKGWLQEK